MIEIEEGRTQRYEGTRTEQLFYTHQHKTMNLGAILDTGFTGRAVCSEQWLKRYQVFLLPHRVSLFIIEKADPCRYLFGQGASVKSVKKTNIPLWDGEKWIKICTRLIDGD